MRAPALLATGIALLVTGCISARYQEGSAIPWSAVERIEPGLTTRGQILAWFGAPSNFSNPSALTTFLESNGLEPDAFAQYPFTDVFAYQVNRGRLDGFTAIFYNRVDLEIVSDTLLVMFDEEGVVSHVGVRRAPVLDQ